MSAFDLLKGGFRRTRVGALWLYSHGGSTRARHGDYRYPGHRRRFSTASDGELLVDGDAIETLERLVDGSRVRFAGELERRSKPMLDDRRLSLTHGARDRGLSWCS